MARNNTKDEENISLDKKEADLNKNTKSSKRIGLTGLAVLLLIAGAGGFYSLQTTNLKLANELKIKYDGKINALNSQIESLNGEIRQLKNFRGISASELDERLQNLPQNNPVVVSAENENVVSDAKLVEIKKQLAQISAQQSASSAVTPNEMLLASGALIVRDMAEKGNSFEYETEVLQILAENNEIAQKYVDVIKQYAISGINGRAMLIGEFENIYFHLPNKKMNKNEEKTLKLETYAQWRDYLWQRLKGLIVTKKTTETFTSAPDEVYELIKKGDFAQALNKIKTSEKYSNVNSAELEEFKIQAQKYVDFNNAVNGLLMNSLANINLKEFEHNRL